ncbi:hypothetical protein E8E11_002649 [Didymella keratinophila]|nr:hypothetical protein E8E11_002649 [Didymella keratinophila]
MDENLRILEQEYCPPIDPALLAAIFSDFADAPNALELARELLDPIKASAVAEQATDFDASGSSGGPVRDSPGKHSSDVDSNADTWATRTTLTDATHLSNDLSALSVDGRSAEGSEESWDGGYYRDTEQSEPKTKEQLLAETFPSLRPQLVAYTLKKCNDDFSKAADELLNHVYFEDAKSSPGEEVAPSAKGIEGFFEGHHLPQKSKKGKNKKKQRVSLYDMSSANSSGTDLPGAATPNRWQNSSRDIDFITARTKLPHKLVSSLYHEKSASLSATILALVNKDMSAQQGKEPEAGHVQDAMDINAAFPRIGLDQTLALVRLADDNSPDKARDLAKALTEQPASATGGKGGIHIDFKYAPVNLSDDEPRERQLPTLAASLRPHTTASLGQKRNDLYNAASAAHKKGGYTRAAAGYYAQEARAHGEHAKLSAAADADYLVASQSSSTILDLHGVTVADATRIAKQKTQAWWNSLGEQRIAEYGGARGGVGEYRIVVGLGRHSADGKGRLGPAVVRALVKEGWKVEAGSGEVVVTGVNRRR